MARALDKSATGHQKERNEMSVTQTPQTWKPGDGPLPSYLEQAALRLFVADHALARHWPDVPSDARNGYRLMVLDKLKDALPLGSAIQDLTVLFCYRLYGLRDIPDALFSDISQYAEETFATLTERYLDGKYLPSPLADAVREMGRAS